jgi:DMSO reductase iron-sulfur subunit
MTYAFYFDSSACSGCKACQVACKDKNNLPQEVLWRRVYEISGGDWNLVGADGFPSTGDSSSLPVWENNIFAYNLSIACNHCVHPKCAGVCPVDAYQVRPDGIVLIDSTRCIGCGYCAWACPYEAPRLDRSAGVMTKCNLCYDNLDAGLPPACVAACPLRCLELVEVGQPGLAARGLELWEAPGSQHPFPLPKLSRTRPHLLLKPHPAATFVGEFAHINNREEISSTSAPVAPVPEIPLMFFTLLAQMAVGAVTAVSVLFWLLDNKQIARQISLLPLLAAGVAITAALLISFLHLGTAKNAWRVLANLRKSWLSREILFSSGFASLLAVLAGLSLIQADSAVLWSGLATCTTLCGLSVIFSMQRVYQFRTIPGWEKGRTLMEFSATTMGLGVLLTAALLPAHTPTGVLSGLALAGLLACLAGLQVTFSTLAFPNRRLAFWRTGFVLAAILGCGAMLVFPGGMGVWLRLLFFCLALVQEAIGRWLFYARRTPGI